MKRRDFISKITMSGASSAASMLGGGGARVQSGLDKYTVPLDRKKAYHLIRRVNFAPTPELVDRIVGKTADQALPILFGSGNLPLPQLPNDDWATKPEENPLTTGSQDIRFQIEGRIKARYKQFIGWWVEMMRNTSLPAQEKMTLFWSTVWCINFQYDTLALIPTPLLALNNQILRKNCFGNYKPFVQDVTLSGAMLMYQSLYYSTKDIPNENYMRELMELFTMGIGQYTEGDIREGSRALTGWRTAAYFGDPFPHGYFNTYFVPNLHDTGAKTLMGDIIPARTDSDNTEDQVKEQEVFGVINILFNRRAVPISEFIAAKIYRYFMYSNTGANDQAIISDLAAIFRNNNFEIMPVLQALFTSQHFFDDANIGMQLKPPPEFIVGLESMLGVKYPNATDAIFELEQVLYDPPNVAGWKAYRTWISTMTFPLRVKYAREILALATDNSLIALAKKLPNFADADKVTVSLEEYFFPLPVEQQRHGEYKQVLLNGASTNDAGWANLINSGDGKAAQGIRNLISEFIKAPDFQLS